MSRRRRRHGRGGRLGEDDGGLARSHAALHPDGTMDSRKRICAESDFQGCCRGGVDTAIDDRLLSFSSWRRFTRIIVISTAASGLRGAAILVADRQITNRLQRPETTHPAGPAGFFVYGLFEAGRSYSR